MKATPVIHILAPANQARTAPEAPRASTGQASGTTQQAAHPRTAPVVATMEPTPTAFWFGSPLAGSAFNGAPARLSPLEFRLLDFLAHQSGRAVPADELAEHLYGAAESGDANAIEDIVARLRKKFGAELITTRRGFGYLIEADG